LSTKKNRNGVRIPSGPCRPQLLLLLLLLMMMMMMMMTMTIIIISAK